MAEWLRSSRTFGRAPTGRVPALSEQMTDRQRLEAELKNKLQVRALVGGCFFFIVSVKKAAVVAAAAAVATAAAAAGVERESRCCGNPVVTPQGSFVVTRVNTNAQTELFSVPARVPKE